MTIFRRAPAGLVASIVFVLGLFYAASAVTYPGPIASEVMLVNAKTGKCLTIAGGVSTENNVTALQFNCDSHPSRTWRISDVTSSGV
jgi:cytolethal distending toxin subunit A